MFAGLLGGCGAASSEREQLMQAYAQETLPPILADPTVPELDVSQAFGDTPTYSQTFTFDSIYVTPDQGTGIPAEILPIEYNDAFVTAVNQPIVKLAGSLGLAETVTISLVDTSKENGHYQGLDSSIRLLIGLDSEESGRDRARMFDTQLDIISTLVHEAGHAFNAQWKINAIDGNNIDGYTEASRACNDMRSAIFEQSLSDDDTRNRLAVDAANAAIDLKDMIDYSPEQLEDWGFASIDNARSVLDTLESTAAQLARNDHRLYEAGHEVSQTCGGVTLGDVASVYDPTLTPDNKWGILMLNGGFDFSVDQLPQIDYAFECITDGNITDQLESDGSLPSPGGHPESNLDETAASLITTLDINPAMLTECYGDLRRSNPETAAVFGNLVQSTLRLTLNTTPQLGDILNQNPASREAIGYIQNN